MKQKILHTPEGVRDIYKVECRKKLALQEKLHHVLHLYGYHDIQTPTFEYFDVFRKEIGSISVPHRPRIYTSFLTGKEIFSPFVRISHHLSPGRPPLCMKLKNCRFGFAI